MHVVSCWFVGCGSDGRVAAVEVHRCVAKQQQPGDFKTLGWFVLLFKISECNVTIASCSALFEPYALLASST